MLVTAALIWGAAFSAQSMAGQHVGPFSLNAVRFLIGAVVLLPVAMLSERRKKATATVPKDWRVLAVGGLLCGVVLFLGSYFQQCGIERTSVGKAGFITALYIILVPLIALIFLKRRTGIATWVGVLIAVAGMYLLCMKEGFSISEGDLYVLACAVVFAVHILVVDRYSPQVNCLWLSCIQLLVAGALSMIPMFAVEKPALTDILAAWQPIVFVGVFSCGVGYTFQMLGQRNIAAPVASLILSMESVFAAIFGVLLLHESMSAREVLGSILMFVAILLVQLWTPLQEYWSRRRTEEQAP